MDSHMAADEKAPQNCIHTHTQTHLFGIEWLCYGDRTRNRKDRKIKRETQVF